MEEGFLIPWTGGDISSGRDAMHNPWAVGLIIFFTVLFLIGVNSGDLDFLLNLGKTICLSCIGVG